MLSLATRFGSASTLGTGKSKSFSEWGYTMQAKQLIAKQLADKFASITFVKKDGTVRKINGRMGVTKDLKGGVNTTAKFGQ